jgi:hypothetical protein
MHNLSELNEYTGAFTGGCFIALFVCVWTLEGIGKVLRAFYLDYRKVNRLDEREKHESMM